MVEKISKNLAIIDTDLKKKFVLWKKLQLRLSSWLLYF